MTISNDVKAYVSCDCCHKEVEVWLLDGVYCGYSETDIEDELVNQGWIWLSMDEQYCSESCNREAHELEPEETLSAAERNPGLCNRR